MKMTYTVEVNAPVEAIYETVLQPENWFSFYPGHQGLEAVEGDWPCPGSAIVLRYGFSRKCSIRLRQAVVLHRPNKYIELHENALRGTWIDRPAFSFEPRGRKTFITVTLRPSTRLLPLLPMIWLIGWLFSFLMPRARERLRAAIEAGTRTRRSSRRLRLCL
jgi:hypothetical protein